MTIGSAVGFILAGVFGYGAWHEIGAITGLAVAYITYITHMHFWTHP